MKRLVLSTPRPVMSPRIQRYARIICMAQGQDPDKTWPPVQVGDDRPKRMWTFHVDTAIEVLKQADADIAKDGAIK